MNLAPFFRSIVRLGCLAVLAGAAVAAQAQTIRSVPQPPAPAQAATYGLPNPAGLTSRFPAGLPETGVIGNAGTPIGAPPASPTPATPGGVVTVPTTGGAAPGSFGYGTGVASGGVGYGAAAAQGPVSGPVGNYTVVQLAQSFLQADANRDGQLTPGEFQRLSIKPYTFEEMDADKDGFVSRSEYDNAVR